MNPEAAGPVEALEYVAEEPLETEAAVLERADGRVEVVGLLRLAPRRRRRRP